MSKGSKRSAMIADDNNLDSDDSSEEDLNDRLASPLEASTSKVPSFEESDHYSKLLFKACSYSLSNSGREPSRRRSSLPAGNSTHGVWAPSSWPGWATSRAARSAPGLAASPHPSRSILYAAIQHEP